MRVHARWVLPIAGAPVADASVVVQDGRITYVGPRAAAPPAGTGGDIDLGDAVLMPGLVNAHTHLELTAMRGWLEDLDFHAWVRTVARGRREALSDREALLDSARLGLAEGVRAGITTCADTCESGVALDAMREAGVRGVVYQEVFGPDPARCEEAMDGLRARVESLRERETALVRVGISPHAPYSVSTRLFAAAARYAGDEKLPIAVHIAESEDESRLVSRGEGWFAEFLAGRGISVAPRARSPVALLADTGVLAARALLIHAVRLDDADIAAIAAAGCPVVHCPASNAKLGHGTAPIVAMLDAGIIVALGSDSVASNNRMDILAEARLAVLAQRARLGQPAALPAAAALAMATVAGARALGLADRIGTLEPGKDADLAAFRLDGPHAMPVHDPVAAAVFSLTGRDATFVAVKGEILLRDGVLQRPDPGLARRIDTVAAALRAWGSEQTQT
jgi:cytosine/adenosine deaminase-related metal-dependent hydrolase